MKLQFSGHDSFIRKHFWLKKGYDLIRQDQRSFNDEMAVTIYTKYIKGRIYLIVIS
jgi:hypothetical protein